MISGSSGLIGSALSAALKARGDAVAKLVRHAPLASDEIEWNADAGLADERAFDDADVVVNLAGENIAQRWTRDAMQRIRDSRVRGTERLARTIAALPKKPRLLISGSAIGIYGSRGDEVLDESSSLGDDFLADVCKEWEAATTPAADAGVRVVTIRMGMVLARGGGAVPKLVLPFELGLGGRVGNGRQWMSWIALRDVVRVVMHAIDTESLRGPVNLVAPNPVRNSEFVRTLAKVLHRPAFVPMPAAAISLLFGRMGRDMLLASQRVRPQRLVTQGFVFEHPTLEGALRAELD